MRPMHWYLYANGRYIGTWQGSVLRLSRVVRIVRYWHGWAIDIAPKAKAHRG